MTHAYLNLFLNILETLSFIAIAVSQVSAHLMSDASNGKKK